MTNGRWYSRAQCFWRIKRYALCWLSYPCIRYISYWLRNVNTNFKKQMKRSVWESIVYRKLLTWTLPTRQIPTWTIPTHTLSIQEIIHHHLAHPNTSIQNKIYKISSHSTITTLIARFMGPTRAHLGPTGPRWAPCWPNDPCYLGITVKFRTYTCIAILYHFADRIIPQVEYLF